MFTLLAIVTCLAPSVNVITIATPRTAVIELASGSQADVEKAKHIWSTGPRTFETEYGSCTVGRMTIERK